MFLVRAASTTPSPGHAPTVLSGYGGFDHRVHAPELGRRALRWLEAGGVYAVANLRGGGEYGEDWHRAGHAATTSRTCSTTSSPPPST